MAAKKICLECGELEHEGACDPQLKQQYEATLSLQELLDLPEGAKLLFKGEEATIKWNERVRFLISKGDPQAKPPVADAYFRSDSVCFVLTATQKPVTITSCFPVPKLLKLKGECERI